MKVSEKVMTAEHVSMLAGTEQENNAMKQARKELLSALDIYDKNVLRGRETETAEEKQAIDKWRQDLLDKKLEAFDAANIPAKIQYYRDKERYQ